MHCKNSASVTALLRKILKAINPKIKALELGQAIPFYWILYTVNDAR